MSGSIHSSLNQVNRTATADPVIKKHLESLREQEEMIKDFDSMTLVISSCFINTLFSYGENQNVFDPPKHQFIISRTKELSNIQFGKLGERALYNYLKNEFPNAEAILQVFGYDNKSYLQLESNIIWLNENVESGKPFDIELSFDCSIKWKDASYYARNLFIEAKTTRASEESIFYFSLNEAEFMVQNYQNYVIARISLLTKAGSYKGTKIHEEFYVNFYKPTQNLIAIIKESLLEWKEHYNAPEVRFTIDHFELISKD